jgi:hypothetical protein
MSNTALNWAWEQDAPSAPAKAILVYLANCADGRGESYPSFATICDRTQVSHMTARKSLKALVEANLLEIMPQYGRSGRQRSNIYRLAFSTTPLNSGPYVGPLPNDDDWRPSWGEPSQIEPPPTPKSDSLPPIDLGAQTDKLRGDPQLDLGANTLEGYKESKKEPSLRSGRAREAGLVSIDRIADARSIWNEVCVKAGMPACREMPEARRKALQRALTTRFIDPEAWPAFCRTIASSAFLTAGGFGIDWVLKPANLVKIVEGNYGERSAILRKSGISDMQRRFHIAPMAIKLDPEPETDERRLVR